MRRIRLYTLLIIGIGLAACNNKAALEAQQQAQQQHDDSVRNAAIADTKKAEEIAAEKKRLEEEAKADKLKRSQDKEILMRTLASLDADLQGEETRMGSIQSFHLLRTSSEKEAEVRNQAMRINEIKLQIERIKEQLQKLENGEEYVLPEE